MAQANSQFMQEAIALSIKSVKSGQGGPFGAVIVKDGEIIAKAHNQVTSTNDPTAHAEIMAIRQACQVLQTFQLNGCELYTSCEPCPMCLGAIYWARLDRVYYANTKADAADIDFDDQFIYQELDLPIGERQLPMVQMMRQEALSAFQLWSQTVDKTEY
ncbi:nucleoside deaminase [Calothrix rhizosoleniae]|uniref:nucleoside deaminase n=1 Tax=Calothrix rhizosoleniae TaxID=888997 RepID=UPI00190E688A|nr:nucleoside deaminase [Calothrix rhizosoleniae]